jgi:hypothetical protein
MSGSTFHARTLRAIGQDLEAHGITQFNLTSFKDGYLVRAVPRTVESDASQRRAAKKAHLRNGHSNGPSEIAYTEQSIDRLDELGRAKRDIGNKLPDFFSLSQCLRAVGAVIDAKRGQLLQLDRSAAPNTMPSIVIHYQTSTGVEIREVHPSANVYDFSVHMYKSRRPEADPMESDAESPEQSH